MTPTIATKAFGIETVRNFLSRLTTNRQPSVPTVDEAGYRRSRELYRQRVTDYANRLASQSLGLNEFGRLVRDEIARHHLTGMALGLGGLRNMTSDDYNRVNAIVNRQLGFFARYLTQLAAMDTINAAQVVNRLMMYANNADSTLQAATLAQMGLPPLPATPRDGSTDCLVNCKCRWRVKKLRGNGNWDVRWVLGDAEHCETCKTRARVWNPLQIRNGKIITDISSRNLYR